MHTLFRPHAPSSRIAPSAARPSSSSPSPSIPFLILLMGVFDLGRGIYTMNGTSEAAREITRVTIVHLD